MTYESVRDKLLLRVENKRSVALGRAGSDGSIAFGVVFGMRRIHGDR